MKNGTKMLYEGFIRPDELSRIPHMIYPADFNTNYPSLDRIDRIANEINEYLKYKHKNTEGGRGEVI